MQIKKRPSVLYVLIPSLLEKEWSFENVCIFFASKFRIWNATIYPARIEPVTPVHRPNHRATESCYEEVFMFVLAISIFFSSIGSVLLNILKHHKNPRFNVLMIMETFNVMMLSQIKKYRR